ncbi:hypothetical protein SLEP1_g30303 [Rubroshorea leprosula]|uniref:DNA-directed RNA polymerase n=1 Tax=Rubroshorea leprosula TaxID=152421 RepID=A0AAV5K228_9ROSI|nr:hypothetical protein SLEP1_g30303 [Rubroshorea leprosula]
MPFPLKIQPIDCQTIEEPNPLESVKPVAKSRLKRLFERPFHGVLKNSAAEKVGVVEEPHFSKDASVEFEPSSVCLAKMVQNFIEENNEKQQTGAARCSRNRCNCFNRNCSDSSEDELDLFGGFGDSNLPSSGEAVEILKSLVPCPTVNEMNLLADMARIVDKNKICKRKDDFCRKIVTDELSSLGYDASICKSRWEKSPSCPAGEYEYIDVIIEGERLLVDIDFRSEFEIARSTKTYKSVLQTLPYIFVGKSDRLQRIITIICEAATQSLKKKGMHIPPWRKAEYVKAKWLTPHIRSTSSPPTPSPSTHTLTSHQEPKPEEKDQSFSESDLVKDSVDGAEVEESLFVLSESSEEEEKEEKVMKEWKPPEIKPKCKSSSTGIRIVTGLASVIEDD